MLSDVSRRLMFQAYLQLSNLEYSTKIVNNANYMSPTGMFCERKPGYLILHGAEYHTECRKTSSLIFYGGGGNYAFPIPMYETMHDSY